MREWLVIESSMKRAVFADPDIANRKGYIPRDAVEAMGIRLETEDGRATWFTREDGERMRAHPEWRDTEPEKAMTTSAPQDDLAPMSQSDVKLPCDVLLPPNTIIRKGCSVTTLMLALFQRTHFPEADTVLDRRASPAPAAPQDSETVTEEMVVAALAAAMKTSEDEVRRFYPGSDFASMRRALTAALAAKAKG